MQGWAGGAGVQAPGRIWRGVGARPFSSFLPFGLRPAVCVLHRRGQCVRPAARAAIDGRVPCRRRLHGAGPKGRGRSSGSAASRRSICRRSSRRWPAATTCRRSSGSRTSTARPRRSPCSRERSTSTSPTSSSATTRCARRIAGVDNYLADRDAQPGHGRGAGQSDRAPPAAARPFRLLLPTDRRLVAGQSARGQVQHPRRLPAELAGAIAHASWPGRSRRDDGDRARDLAARAGLRVIE